MSLLQDGVCSVWLVTDPPAVFEPQAAEFVDGRNTDKIDFGKAARTCRVTAFGMQSCGGRPIVYDLDEIPCAAGDAFCFNPGDISMRWSES